MLKFIDTANLIKNKALVISKRIKSETKASTQLKTKNKFKGKTVTIKGTSSKSAVLAKSTSQKKVNRRNQVTKRNKTKLLTLLIILAVTSLVLSIAIVGMGAWAYKIKELEYHVIKDGVVNILRLKINTCTQVGILHMQTKLLRFGSNLKQNIYNITQICKCDGKDDKVYCKQVCQMTEDTKKTTHYLDSDNQSLEELYNLEIRKVCDPPLKQEEIELNQRKDELAKEVEKGMLFNLVTGLISGIGSAATMTAGVADAFEGTIDAGKIFGQGKAGEILKNHFTPSNIGTVTDLITKSNDSVVSTRDAGESSINEAKMWLSMGVAALVLIAAILGKLKGTAAEIATCVVKLAASFLSLVIALLGCHQDNLTPFKCFIASASPMKDVLISVIELAGKLALEASKSLTIVLAVASALVDIGVQLANFIQGVAEVVDQYEQLAKTKSSVEEIKIQIKKSTCGSKIKTTNLAISSFEDQVNTESIETAISEFSENDANYASKIRHETVKECNSSAIYCFLFTKETELRKNFGLEDPEISYLKEMTIKGPINDIIIAPTILEGASLEKLGLVKISNEISTIDNISFYACIGCNTSGFIQVITGVHIVEEKDKADFLKTHNTNSSIVNFYKLTETHYFALIKQNVNLQSEGGYINNAVADIKITEDKEKLINIKYTTKNIKYNKSETNQHFDFSKDSPAETIGGDFGDPNLSTKRVELEPVDVVNNILTDFSEDCNNKNQYIGVCTNATKPELDGICKTTLQFMKRSAIRFTKCSCSLEISKLYAFQELDQATKNKTFGVVKNESKEVFSDKKALSYFYPSLSDVKNNIPMKRNEKYTIKANNNVIMRSGSTWEILSEPKEVVCQAESCDFYEMKNFAKKKCFCDLIQGQNYIKYDDCKKKTESTEIYVPKTDYLSTEHTQLTEFPISTYNWKLCAIENEQCDVTNEFPNDPEIKKINVVIRYGMHGQYNYKNDHKDRGDASIKCSNWNFGDSIKGVTKRCWYIVIK